MHVIIFLLILIFIVYAFQHWYISLPILAFLGYLSNLIICTPQQRRNPIRHLLWWVFLILFTGCMYHRDDISRFAVITEFEYSEWSEDLVLKTAIENDKFLDFHSTSSSLSSNELFGGLQIGMSPLRTSWHIARHEEILDAVYLDSISLTSLRRYYSNKKLYAISFDIDSDYGSKDCFVKAIHFFSNKYGAPHHTKNTDKFDIAQWNFAEKHIVINCVPNSYKGTLYIYNPDLLQQKIDSHFQEEAREKAKIEKRIKGKEEEKIRQEKAFEEELKKMELQKRRLRESL